jgi:hypothetical protein
MILLVSTSDIIRVVTSSTANIDVHASWVDWVAAATYPTPGRTNTTISTATTTTIVGSPGASTYRTLKTLTLSNRHATAVNTITVQHYDGTTSAQLFSVTLAAGQDLIYDEGSGWHVYDATGRLLVVSADSALTTALAAGQTIDLYKAFGTAKAGGSPQSGWLANPSPGVASPAYTAGSGYTCSRTTTGALPLVNATAKNRIAAAIAGMSTVSTVSVYDRLWSCSGMGFAAATYTVTTPGSLPARVTDNGAGCEVWIEQFVAAGVASGTATLNYVNAAGNNVSAVISAVASAPVAGQLQRFPINDGIRSVTSVVTSATWTSGSFGVTIMRRLLDIPCAIANVPNQLNWTKAAMREVPADACLMMVLMPTTTTATNATGTMTLVDMA